MRAAYQELVDNSLGATLSAIEIYNKPDFQYRNETFVILIINAWELLLKAKLLKDNNHNKTCLYVRKSNGQYKRSRTGNYLTIEIRGALEKLSINNLVRENLEGILEIRDTAIHFYNKDTISYAIFALGAATLQNYQKLIKQWFGKDLSAYNFYILPLGFKYSFKNFNMIDVSKEPEAVQNLLENIVKSQTSGKTEDAGFYLVADIKTEITSAKKMANEADIRIAIDKHATAKGVMRPQKVTDVYPYSASQVSDVIRDTIPDLGQNKIWYFIKQHAMKDNPKYSSYVFSSKKSEEDYKHGNKKPPTISVYNQDAIEYIMGNIEE